MVDDMGYSDLGVYGSELHTPNLDRLANDGLRFRQFRNYSRCCPSRAALMTGRYAHEVQLGWMTAADEQRPGYRAGPSLAYPMLSEILRPLGYSTHMVGKWHLSPAQTTSQVWQSGQSHGTFPTDRGFDSFFGITSGGGSRVSYDDQGKRIGGGYFTPWMLLRGNQHIPVEELPEDFFLTTALGDEVVRLIDSTDDDQPYFIYYAPFAPHMPVEAPAERVERVRPRYEVGYEVLWQQRIHNMAANGLLPEGWTPADVQPWFEHAWNELSQEEQAAWIERASNYATLVEIVDEQIGRACEALRRRDELDNTLVIFLSDNGATKFGGKLAKLLANLNNAPYRQYKSSSYEGGVSSPLIMHWPAGLTTVDAWINGRPHITDIVPTVLAAVGTPYPSRWGLAPLPALESQSLLTNRTAVPERALFFEHESTRAVITGDWKLVSGGYAQPWELYNLTIDPYEYHDRAEEHPEVRKDLAEQWQTWAIDHDVLPLEPEAWSRIKKYRSE